MWVVMYRAKGRSSSEQQVFGPFQHYLDAEDFLTMLPPASQCEHKYIASLRFDPEVALKPINYDVAEYEATESSRREFNSYED